MLRGFKFSVFFGGGGGGEGGEAAGRRGYRVWRNI